MSKLYACAAFAALTALAGAARAEDAAEMAKKGAQAYRICSACHSLKPGVHLSGPSLAGLWGGKAASVKGFGRYTEGLKKSDIVWDEDTLNAWLADPGALVPGTTMQFRGIENDQTRVNLIAFLRVALGEDGAARVVAQDLISERMAEGQIPPDLREAGPDNQITAISHCGDAYHVTTASGNRYPLWETNVRLKIDTSERGPRDGKPVLMHSGMVGDRVSVVFASLEQMQKQLKETCTP